MMNGNLSPIGPGRFAFALGRMDLLAAATAGVVAGAASLIVLLVLSVSVYDESPWKLMRMIAAVGLGPKALEPDDEFSLGIVFVGLVVHFVLAFAFAFAASFLVKDFPDAAVPWVGLAFGVALYFANLHGFAKVFPWLAPLRTIDTVLAHALFGIVAATVYRQFARPR
jgi:hypothetical protein